MSSFNRRTLLMMPLALGACGFTPAYGPGGPAQGLQGRIRAADPTDKNSFDLVERLEERLGRPESAVVDLSYTIATRTTGTGITLDNAITRFQLFGNISWVLSNSATGERITGGKVQNFTSYSATGSSVAGLTAESDANHRLMRMLADQIVTQLLATSGNWA